MTDSKQGKIYPCCALCHRVPPGGIHDGMRVMGRFICSDCEAVLTHLTQDDPRYNYFVQLVNGAFEQPFHQALYSGLTPLK